ncbi:MAG: T9SS type A sorting domain-containing protein [Vicingaceae bacterium]
MKKVLLSLMCLIGLGTLSAQTYTYVDINQISFVDSLSLDTCNDNSAYIGDTIVTRGIVVTDGNLSEVASSSITGGSRPFIALVDTADGGSPGPFKGAVVMGADPLDNPVSDIENAVAGDILEMTCIIAQFGGLLQLQPLDQNSVSNVGIGAVPTFETISAGEIQDANGLNILPTGEQWEGSYVELKNMTVVQVNVFSSGSRTEFVVEDSLGNRVLVGDRFLPMVVNGVATVNPNSPDSVGSFVAPSVGTVYNHIRGIIFQDENGCAGGGNFSGGYEINPVYASDFDKQAPPPSITNVSRNPVTPNDTQSVTVTAEIFDTDGVVTGATLFYSADQTAALNLFSSVTMTNTIGSEYSAGIPAFPLDSVVRYYIEATDDSSLTSSTSVDFYTVRPNGTTIMDIQEVPSFISGDASPLVGDTVTVTGFVTASYQTGDLGYLYIQDTSTNEYAGIYVDGGPVAVFSLNRGDEVSVTGVVEENFGFTQISATAVSSTGNSATVAPVVLDPSDASLFGSSSNDLEKYESMLLRYENPVASGLVYVADTSLDFAEYTVGSGFQASVSARVLTGRQTNGQAQGSLDVSYINDTSAIDPLNVPAIQVDLNYSMDYLDGILFYAFGNYKLTPRNNMDFANLVVSIESIYSNASNTSVYPNPTSEQVNIQIANDYNFEELKIDVLDINGRVVRTTQTRLNLSNIKLSGMERGVYIIRITNEGELVNSSKLILK